MRFKPVWIDLFTFLCFKQHKFKGSCNFFFLKASFQQGSSFFKGKRLVKDFFGQVGMFFALSLALGAC